MQNCLNYVDLQNKKADVPERVLSATFKMAPAPVPRLDGAAIQIKNLLYVFAGYGTIDFVHSHVDVYNFTDNTWGGRGPTARTFVLDTKTKQWSDMPPLPVPREISGVVTTLQNAIVLIYYKDSLGFPLCMLKGHSSKELVVRDEEMNPPCDLGFECAVEGEEIVRLPSNIVKFSSGLGMAVAGFKKEINSLLKKLESRKGRGIKGFGGKKKFVPSSRFEREI
ncbi:hypothetical protein AAG906_030745 [Vitis piasezkii]